MVGDFTNVLEIFGHVSDQVPGLVVVEEGFPQSSVGDFISNSVQRAAFDYLDAPILTIAGKDVPMPYAANLEKLALPNVDEVIQAVKTVCYK